MGFAEELSELTARCRSCISAGNISMYSNVLKELAELFQKNDLAIEQLKMLITAFYIDLSGFGRAAYIDRKVVESIQSALKSNELDVHQLETMYFDLIWPDFISKHTLNINDCWYLMRLCIEGKTEHADYILSKI